MIPFLDTTSIHLLIIPVIMIGMMRTNVYKSTHQTRLSGKEIVLMAGIIALTGWFVPVDDVNDPQDGSAREVTVQAPWLFSRADHP
jgi:hypothetical protein